MWFPRRGEEICPNCGRAVKNRSNVKAWISYQSTKNENGNGQGPKIDPFPSQAQIPGIVKLKGKAAKISSITEPLEVEDFLTKCKLSEVD